MMGFSVKRSKKIEGKGVNAFFFSDSVYKKLFSYKVVRTPDCMGKLMCLDLTELIGEGVYFFLAQAFCLFNIDVSGFFGNNFTVCKEIHLAQSLIYMMSFYFSFLKTVILNK